MNVELIEHLARSYNDPSFSDFKLIEMETQKELYLHTYVLRSNPFFAQYFGSAFAKPTMEVESIMCADILARYIYTYKFRIGESIHPDDFFDLLQLSEMWQMPTEILDDLFTFAYIHMREFIDQDLAYANLLYHHFNDYIPGDSIWTGSQMTYRIINQLTERKEKITEDMLEWDIVKLLSIDIMTELLIKYHRYENLNILPIICNVSHLIKKYYDPARGIFTPEQLQALTDSEYTYPCNKRENYLVIDSFVPFRACHYRIIGMIYGKSKLSHGVIMTLCRLEKTDIIYFGGQEYLVKSLFINLKDISECSMKKECLLNPMECPTLPDKGTNIYRVTRW